MFRVAFMNQLLLLDVGRSLRRSRSQQSLASMLQVQGLWLSICLHLMWGESMDHQGKEPSLDDYLPPPFHFVEVNVSSTSAFFLGDLYRSDAGVTFSGSDCISAFAGGFRSLSSRVHHLTEGSGEQSLSHEYEFYSNVDNALAACWREPHCESYVVRVKFRLRTGAAFRDTTATLFIAAPILCDVAEVGLHLAPRVVCWDLSLA